MRSRIRAACLAVWAANAVPVPAAAWDFPGHRIVGAIADLVLQQHYPATQQRVNELLEKNDGGTVTKRTLSEVAVFPDCAKKGNVPFCGRPPSDEEKAYAERNPHHDKFRFADVPLQQPSYVPNTAGTENITVEAHQRLTIRKGSKPSPFSFTGGCTWETTLDPSYEDWAKAQARIQVAKAGFRLAALFKAIFEL